MVRKEGELDFGIVCGAVAAFSFIVGVVTGAHVMFTEVKRRSRGYDLVKRDA